MRFAIIGPVHPLRGGIAQYTTSLYQALVPEHEVLLVSFSRQYPKFLFPGKTQVDNSLSPFKAPGKPLLDSISPFSWLRAGSQIAAFSPDVLLFQCWRPFFAPVYQGVIRQVRRSISLPVIFLCHNILSHEEIFLPGQRLWERYLIKLGFHNIDGFMVHAEELVDFLHHLKPNAQVRRIFHPLYEFYNRLFSEFEFCVH